MANISDKKRKTAIELKERSIPMGLWSDTILIMSKYPGETFTKGQKIFTVNFPNTRTIGDLASNPPISDITWDIGPRQEDGLWIATSIFYFADVDEFSIIHRIDERLIAIKVRYGEHLSEKFLKAILDPWNNIGSYFRSGFNSVVNARIKPTEFCTDLPYKLDVLYGTTRGGFVGNALYKAAKEGKKAHSSVDLLVRASSQPIRALFNKLALA